MTSPSSPLIYILTVTPPPYLFIPTVTPPPPHLFINIKHLAPNFEKLGMLKVQLAAEARLCLVLSVEKKKFVIEQPIPPAPAADSAANVLVEWNAIYDAYNEELKSMFEKQAGVKRFDLIQTFHAGKQEEDLTIGLILNGLTKDFARFVRNYNMHNIRKTIGKLHVMLIEYEKSLPKKAKTPQVMEIRGGKIQKTNKKSLKAKGKGKANGKGKDKQVYIPKPTKPKPTAKEIHSKDDTCHHYKKVDHWKRNCPFYLAELLKKKKQVGTASSSGSRKLEQRALYLYVGNNVRAQVEAIRSFNLVLPNGLVICLDNCHYAPIITRGVVSVHHLVENGFVQLFTNCGISVSKNDVLYFNAIPSNGIYEIDMHDLVPNVNSIYNVSTKRAKHNLDSTYLWHCRLAHISKKRIEKIQQEGLLKSTDDESLDQCVSCLSGKMTRKSFSHRPERATDLLGIIHTDMCGPLRHVSRQVLATSLHSRMIIVVMVMFISLKINIRSLKHSRCVRMKWKINSRRQS
ncbi:retrotransposon protein, putative, ty1-copia subclass [Tanacetum coccineum]|uniref:Retrotransposon protein, putative, ty1-copia subclass n=1 Tax=Tanacetum coccineum TaxID=301880 RepID=A0ABQ4ZLZ5_9ASTR